MPDRMNRTAYFFPDKAVEVYFTNSDGRTVDGVWRITGANTNSFNGDRPLFRLSDLREMLVTGQTFRTDLEALEFANGRLGTTGSFG